MTIEVNRAFWAKKDDQNGLLCWLPLSQHLDDTRSVCGLLWEHWLSRGQKEVVTRGFAEQTGIVDPEELDLLGKHVAMFLGAVHDIGKATPAFQTKTGYGNTKDLDLLLLEKLEREGFVKISSLDLANPGASPHNIAGQVLLYGYSERFRINNDLCSIVGGHHGKPIDNIRCIEDQISAYEANYYQTEAKDQPIHHKWELEQKKICQWALEACQFEKEEDIPELTQPAMVILLGLLTMADWIASNTSYFPLISVNEDTVPDPEARLEKGFTKWIGSSRLWEPNDVCEIDELYISRFGFEPRDVQKAFSEVVSECNQPGIFIFEAPMGIGKTEAALAAAEQLAVKTHRSGLFFGLPTQATSNGIFPRIQGWLSNIYDENRIPVHLRLVHGKAYLNEGYANLIRSSQIALDGDESNDRNGFEVNQWFAGRKTTILDDFIVGTVDQFLLAALKQKHLALRHLGFSKKVVVIDEVHAYDTYMSQYLHEALTWMGAYGVPVILLSATLPKEARTLLIKSYLMGKKEKLKEKIDTEAYPLITFTDGVQYRTYDRFIRSEGKKVRVEKVHEEDIAGLVGSLVKEEGNIGIIVNTVKKAQELSKTFAGLFGDDVVEVLHSAFIASERIEKEKSLLKTIGKGKFENQLSENNVDFQTFIGAASSVTNGTLMPIGIRSKDVRRPKKKIVIGTQVIEQSLDIDFDVMISELCPMDLLIQRAGRLHRHQRTRPAVHKDPVLYVFGTSDELLFDPGSEAVYGGYLLTRTQYYLPENIIIPNDISPLVQRTYGKEDIVLTEDQEEKYSMYKAKDEDLRNKKTTKARTFRLKEPVFEKRRSCSPDLIGWLDNPQINLSEERAYAQVRDSDETIEVIALRKKGSGYTTFQEEADLSGAATENKNALKIAASTIKLPGELCRPYIINSVLTELEEYYRKHFACWEESPWLKGTLGIIFDENNEFILNKYKLRYDPKYGLSLERG